jgi:hypothetical protein
MRMGLPPVIAITFPVRSGMSVEVLKSTAERDKKPHNI